MNRSIGILRYSEKPFKLIIDADDGIAQFYRAMVPKYITSPKKLSVPMFRAHISVVRQSVPVHMDMWKCYEGRSIEFEYESYVYNDEMYYWLNCYSIEIAREDFPKGQARTLEEIRTELGLTPHDKVTYSPDGRHRFHMTIGNVKS